MEEYPNNSNKFKEQEHKPEGQTREKEQKIINGTAKKRKPGAVKELASALVPGSGTDIKNRIIGEVIVPIVEKTIYGIITGVLESIFPSLSSGTKKKGPASRISYQSYYESKDEPIRSSGVVRKAAFDEIVIDSRGEAESVLERMDELVDRFGIVSVADYYDMLGMSHDYTDCNYGWDDISNAKVIRTVDGFVIRLPKVKSIN